MPNCTQVSISRTEGEWALILNKICPPGDQPMKAMSKHIRRETLKIKTRLKELPESIVWMGGEKVEKKPWVDNSILADIDYIATTMKVSRQTVIDRLIITPLLNQP